MGFNSGVKGLKYDGVVFLDELVFCMISYYEAVEKFLLKDEVSSVGHY